MAMYRRRPVPVEAIQFISGKVKPMREFLGEKDFRPVADRNKVLWFRIPIKVPGRYEPSKLYDSEIKLAPEQWLVRDEEGYNVFTDEEFHKFYEVLP